MPLESLLPASSLSALTILVRLIVALVLGVAVAFVYRRARSEPWSSFTTTLIMLAILIAMVTQVIGDNIARAFSLVGALSIVRFRTVVRDTQDTAYVIFAVAVGMAAGADNVALGVIGIGVTALGALWMRPRPEAERLYHLTVRVSLGTDASAVLATTLGEHARLAEPTTVATARQGAALEASYRIGLRAGFTPEGLVTAVNRLDGVQSVSLRLEGTPEV